MAALSGWQVWGLNPANAPHQAGFSEWTMTDGLPQNSVESITQTSDGYMWIGTAEGLARFDGVRFVTFELEGFPELRTGVISTLREDGNGRLWIGTRGGLLFYENGVFGRTEHPVLGKASIRDVIRDESGVIIASNHGVFRYADDAYTLVFGNEDYVHRDISKVVRDSVGDLWIAARPVFKSEGDSFLELGASEGMPRSGNCLISLPGGKVLLGSNAGLVEISTNGTKIYTTEDGLVSNLVRSLLRDRDENVWVGTPNGLQRFTDGIFQDARLHLGESIGAVVDLYEDREGGIWVGTHSGLLLLRDRKIQTIGRLDGLAQENILSMVESRRGGYWIGTWGGGLSYFLGSSSQVWTRRDGLADESVYAMAEDAAGGLWLGYSIEGLSRLTEEGIEHFGPESGWVSSRVRSIAIDAENRAWVASVSNGLWCYEDGRFRQIPIRDFSSNLGAMTFDREGRLWVGSEDAVGVLTDGNWTSFSYEDGLHGSTTYAIHEDPSGSVWVGRKRGALQRIRSGVVDRFSINGDSSLDIFGIQSTENELWLNCRRGVVQISLADLDRANVDGVTDIVGVTYGESDGMPRSGPSLGGNPSSLRTTKGAIWFASNGGVVRFNPGQMVFNDVPPGVVLESIRADGFTYDPGERAVTIPPGNGTLEFAFAITSFVDPARSQFRYRLVGLNDDWTYGAGERVVRYAGVPPGDYQFEINASNNEGVWAPLEAGCLLTVEPHIYQTWWFWPAVLLLASLVLWSIYGIRVRGLRVHHEALRQLVEKRTADLRDARDAAQAANRAKSDFLANMSHEIRTPMNGVLGMTELALDLSENREQRDYLQTAKRSADALLTVINDILDFSKVESGHVQIDRAPFDLRECVECAIELLGPIASEKRLELLVRVAPELPAKLNGDAARLRQVLVNLLGNAVKFCEEGEVLLDVYRCPHAESPDRVVFEISDTGIGIPETKLETIFSPFVQADGAMTRRFGGTGLGLAICRQLVELMEGSIFAESVVGTGSRFTFSIDLPPVDGGRPPVHNPGLSGCRVLFVEACQRAREIHSEWSGTWGMASSTEASVSDAIRLLDGEHGPAFDFVVVDVETLLRDEVASGPRLASLCSNATTLVALAPPDRSVLGGEMTLPSGSFQKIPKPLIARRLHDRFCAALNLPLKEPTIGDRDPIVELPVCTLSGSPRPPRILVAEDNGVNQRIARLKLERLGYDVTIASDGNLAISSYQDSHYDVILMDAQMPVLDGLDATRRIREIEEGTERHIYIIAMTAHVLPEEIERCLAAGMDAYCGKPTNWPELNSLIRKGLEPGDVPLNLLAGPAR